MRDSKTKVKNPDRVAYGLMQVTAGTLKILRDEKGELRDHLVNLTRDDLLNPYLNIAAGTRWLFRKWEIAMRKKKNASWIDAVREYKSYKTLDAPQMKKFKRLYDQLNKK